jgi:hypothetical protein
MTCKITIHQKATYLHAIVTGQNNRENVERYLQEIRAECIARRCFRVLVEERLEGPRLHTVDVFDVIADGPHDLRGMTLVARRTRSLVKGSSQASSKSLMPQQSRPFASIHVPKFSMCRSPAERTRVAPVSSGQADGHSCAHR